MFRWAFTEDPPDDVEEDTVRAAGYLDTDDNIESGESSSPKSAVISRDIEINLSPFSKSNPETVPADTIESEPTPADMAEPGPEPNQTDTPSESIALSQTEQEADTSWNYGSARLLEAWRRRDWSGPAQRDQENPDNDNPYGFWAGGVGICRGYTATFQLFMGLLGFECISVQGQSSHAWNVVRLDGEWYCVDVAWDESGAPEASGTGLAWNGNSSEQST